MLPINAIGKNGDRICQNDNGELLEKIIVPMVMRGIIQLMIWLEAKPTVGVKKELQDLVIANKNFVFL